MKRAHVRFAHARKSKLDDPTTKPFTFGEDPSEDAVVEAQDVEGQDFAPPAPGPSRKGNNFVVPVNSSKGIKPAKGYITFKNLSYSVTAKDENGSTVEKVLLQNINGFVRPGMLIALMGPSGGGKTTLMDVLAGRKTGGKIGGEILVNGKPKDQFFNRVAGYVEQFDLLLGTQTVRDAVVFSAMLRLPDSFSRFEKIDFAENIMRQLNLTDYAHVLLGQGSSPELRKRTTIAIEMVSNPSLLFLGAPRHIGSDLLRN
eukprot:tig00000361_g24413.t1